MKYPFLIVASLTFICTTAMAQERREIVPGKSFTAVNIKSFLDTQKKKKTGILPEAFKQKAYPEPQYLPMAVEKIPNNIVVYYAPKHSMPVLTPGSDYIFTMPGSFAYDKSKAIYPYEKFVTEGTAVKILKEEGTKGFKK